MNKYKMSMALSTALLTATAQAEMTFNGFASVVGGITTGSDESHMGYEDTLGFKQDSLFALQARADLGDGLSATAQIIATGSKDFEANFEWAYVSYELNDNNTLSVGKFRFPLYLYSDYLDVRYAYHWITPPAEVYSSLITSLEGVTLVNTTTVGDWDVTTQAWYGGASDFATATDAIISEFQELAGANTLWNKEWLTLRGVYVTGELDYQLVSLNGLFAGLTQAGYGAVASELELKGPVDYYGVGFQADFEQYFVMGEFATVEFGTRNPAPSDLYYVSAGYRTGDWTYHYTFSARETDVGDTGFITNTIPDIPQLAALRAGALATLGNGDDETVHTVGFRYEFQPAAAFKMEYRMFEDSIDTEDDASLLRFAIDVVF